MQPAEGKCRWVNTGSGWVGGGRCTEAVPASQNLAHSGQFGGGAAISRHAAMGSGAQDVPGIKLLAVTCDNEKLQSCMQHGESPSKYDAEHSSHTGHRKQRK